MRRNTAVSASLPEFNRGVIRPVECLKAGWALIKGEYWLFLGITFVGIIIGGTVPLGILMGPMMCGIYLCFLRRMRGERVEFGMLFKGFDSFGDGVIAGLIQVIPVMVMIVPLYIAFVVGITVLAPERGSRRAVNDPNAMITFLIIMGVMFVVIMLLSMIISALFMFSYPLIMERKLSGFNAVKTSARAVFGNLGGVLGLMMLNVVLGIIGMLFCYIGALFVMPIGMAAWAIAYRQVFPEPQSFSGGI
jgi:uncharacterized membrane protein